MISITSISHVIFAIIPLYAALAAAYISLKWCKIFTPDQCSGISKFVAKFSIPLLSFRVISSNNPYRMNLKLIYADIVQKSLSMAILAVYIRIRPGGNLEWLITGFSLSTLPNTLVLGIPLLKAMYGEEAGGLLAQIVALQSLVWYNILLLLFEVNAANKSSNIASSPPRVAGESEDRSGEETIRIQKERKTIDILLTVGKKLIRNPSTHAALLGLVWACIHFRFGLKLPNVIEKSVSILSDGGLGMAMFSLGLFVASRNNLRDSTTRKTVLAMAMKFGAGPSLMAVSSMVIGLRGTLLQVAIIQAALPQGLVPFVFAKEYDVHAGILSTGVIFGLLIAVPIALAYYFMLNL